MYKSTIFWTDVIMNHVFKLAVLRADSLQSTQFKTIKNTAELHGMVPPAVCQMKTPTGGDLLFQVRMQAAIKKPPSGNNIGISCRINCDSSDRNAQRLPALLALS